MKIGIISYDLSLLAGGNQLSLTLGNELQKEGHEIAYACVYEGLDKLSKKFGHKFHYKVYKKNKPIFGKIFINYNTLINHPSPIYKMCKEFKPDVVIEAGDFPCSLLVPILLKIPSIHYVIETSYYYSQKNLLNRVYFMPLKPIEKMIVRRASICTISNYTTNVVQKIWDVTPTIISPPVDTDMFTPSKEKGNIILCVIRFLSQYKFKEMIDAFRELDSPDYALVLIGGVDSENEGYYDSLKEYTTNDVNIKLIANADFDVLLNYYRKSKLFWYPIDLKLYSIAVAEAQSAGLPAISFGTKSEYNEIIMDSKTGYFVNDFDEMIEKTRLLMNDEKLLKEMSIAARENAVERLGLDVFRNKFIDVIEEVKNAR